MKLVRGALLGAVALGLVGAPTMALADSASKLSLTRASTAADRDSELEGPKFPMWVGAVLVGGAVIGVAILATSEDPDPTSP